MRKIALFVATFFIVMILSACNKSLCDSESCVFVTVYPMQYLVEEIAGNYVDVARVPGSRVHSESIDWSAKEIIEMKNADILFYIDGGVDTYIPEKEESIFQDSNVKLVNIADYVTYNEVCFSRDLIHNDVNPQSISTCDENSLSEDPHFWLDPIRMLLAAEIVKDELILMFPEHESVFIENYDSLKIELEDLDDAYKLMALEANKPIVTTIMLFTYWNVRYDIEILPITTSTHSSESSASDIIFFAEEAALHNIHYILFEKNTNSPAGQGVLDELRKVDESATSAYIHGLGNLTTEELDSGLDYLSIMYENLEILKEATK